MANPPLTALFINCTLKKSPETSNTAALIELSRLIMEKNGVSTSVIRAVDHNIAPGVYPDMREQGWETDAWPELWPRVKAADILVLGSPIWLGEQSSICRRVIERLYAHSADTNERGQFVFYNKVAAALVDGNEDGLKHVASRILFSLQHIGYTIPPEADAGWIGPVGPGPSYLGEGSGGPQTDFTNRSITFTTWNLMHLARILKNADGIPAHGNVLEAWNDGERYGFEQIYE